MLLNITQIDMEYSFSNPSITSTDWTNILNAEVSNIIKRKNNYITNPIISPTEYMFKCLLYFENR